MNFSKVLPEIKKKKKILSTNVKDKPCSSPEGPATFLKRNSTYFNTHIPKVLGTSFFIEQLRWLLLKF